jgi:hypothetical protein
VGGRDVFMLIACYSGSVCGGEVNYDMCKDES